MNSNNPVCVRSHEIKSEMTEHIFTTATAASLWFMLKTRVHHFNSHFHVNLHCHFESLPQHVLNLFRMIGKDFFSQGRCPFCHLANSIRALKEENQKQSLQS